MNLWSLPSRERGLKFDELCLQYELDDVAPLAGAWIEIISFSWLSIRQIVAPLAGAWIEISCGGTFCVARRCRSPRGSVD